MTSLVKAIQERLAKICDGQIRDYGYLADNRHFDHMDQAVLNCAAAIRAADLSDLEPKGVELVERLRVWAADIPMVQDQNIPLNGPSLLKLLHEAADTIAALTSENARICAAHKGLMAEADKRLDEAEANCAALTARLEAAEGELNEWEKQAKKFNLDCQDAQSRAFKAERDLEAMRSAERVAKMQERK